MYTPKVSTLDRCGWQKLISSSVCRSERTSTDHLFVHVFTVTVLGAKWIHIYDVTKWWNDSSKKRGFSQESHSSRSISTHRRLFFSPCLPAAVSLCFCPCPYINSSIYSRSLPTLSLSVCYWKSEQWVLLFEYTALSKLRKRKQGWEWKKAPLTGRQTPASPCPPLSPLSVSASMSANNRNLERRRMES